MARFEHVADDGTVFMFREPVRGDARKLMSFINSFVGEPASGILFNKRVSLKEEEKWLESRLSEIRSRSTFIMLVEGGGRIVGSCHISRLPGKHSHRASVGVALRKGVRGRGLGEALMKTTMELGVKRFTGIESLDLSAFAYNERALSLYRKLGFKEYARIPRSAKEGDRYVDEVLMRLEWSHADRHRRSLAGH